MATLVLGAVGTLIGGPLGGVIGSLVGRQLDSAILGSPRREGPRLKELSVTTSSYGQPIARQYGRVRVPGTVIWATDFKEDKETSGGGKGKPKTTSYSYRMSFAVALSSRPIDTVGRIWADGNLLRGAAGDLKTGGTLRIHTGHADQGPDPLLSSALGSQCPAHRGCAYVVFEDLQLADFGNRIPTLSFEVFAGTGDALVSGLVENIGSVSANAPLPQLKGFSQEGGSIGQIMALIDRLQPLTASYDAGVAHVALAGVATPITPFLPEATRWEDGDFGRESGQTRARRLPDTGALAALRYYDTARDFQPGLQRVELPDGDGRGETLEFPGVFDAADARELLHGAAARESIRQETLAWRMAELDPTIAPGCLVRAPGIPGDWLVAGWEWREAGVELQLVRRLAIEAFAVPGDAGSGWLPPDRLLQSSRLRLFEVPWDGYGSPTTAQAFAAVGAPAGPWPGAAIYAVRDGALVSLGVSTSERAIGGALTAPVAASRALRLEPNATLSVQLDSEDSQLVNASPESLANGVNRLLVGNEIVQFARAEPQGSGAWLLRGLVRGRGGTEGAAQLGHPAGTLCTLLDESLLPIPAEQQALASSGQFAALGLADDTPVVASTELPGASRRPPSPCHPRVSAGNGGGLVLDWTRRARGGWAWLDDVEQPLVEQEEIYEIGVGPVAAPVRRFAASSPSFAISATLLAELAAQTPGSAIWVRQCGSFAKSEALMLATLPATP